jgi:hypothetical protein
MHRRSPLHVLGIGDIEESVYRALLEDPGLESSGCVRAKAFTRSPYLDVCSVWV